MRKLLWIVLLADLCFLNACGVKGKPMPPLTPPVLGRGEPNYSRATENVQIKNRKAKNNSNSDSKSADDWDEPADFPSEGSEK